MSAWHSTSEPPPASALEREILLRPLGQPDGIRRGIRAPDVPTHRADRTRLRHLLPDRVVVGAWVFAIVAWLALALVIVTPWPFEISVRHFAAAFGCDAARAAGLAPSRRGEAGYWPWLDRDHDGIACEPWPRRQRTSHRGKIEMSARRN